MTPSSIPHNVTRQVGLARMLWLQAQADLAIPSNFAAGEAIKCLHDAFEVFMAAIYRYHNGADTWVDFAKYPEKIKAAAAGKRMRHDQVVRELNYERVRTKHHGNLPLYGDARSLAERCGVFLAENCELYFDIPFREVRLSSFVEHAEVREFLVKAEDAIEANDLMEAMTFLQVAFQIFVGDAVGERLPMGHTSLFTSAQSLPDRFEIDRTIKDHATRQLWLRIAEGVKKTQDLIELQAIGINPLERAVFDAMTPIVHITAANKIAGRHPKSGQSLLATRENANWAMGFVLGSILRFQTIPAPFDAWGRHSVRAVAAEAVIDVDSREVRRLKVGEVISEAGFCLHMVGDAWVWEEGGEKRFAKVAACERIESRRHAEIGRERVREQFKKRQAADPTRE